MKKLTREFYNQPTIKVAKLLLGKFLIRKIGKKIIAGKIVETEAYIGLKDLASHASRGKTSRNAVMFGPPGHAYVYLIYGLNYCFNIVTEKKDYPAAVLIRAVEPADGVDFMRQRRKTIKKDVDISNGPGKLCQAMRIDKSLNNINLSGKILWVEDRGIKIKSSKIIATKRIGVDYAKEYKNKPWRFYLAGNLFVSKK